MGLFDWLNPKKEKNRVLVELYDDNGNSYLIDIPRGRTPNQVTNLLANSGFEKDPLPESRQTPQRKRQILEARDSNKYRWISAESVNKNEDLEDNGDFEPDDFKEADYCDDEASNQRPLRFWLRSKW